MGVQPASLRGSALRKRMSANLPHFESTEKLLSFARQFLRDQVDGFRQDIGICLTMDSHRRHAYFPALIRCISFLDFLGGLYAGDIESHSLNELQKYARQFMDRSNYDDLLLGILYEGFRHKIAHLSNAYPVFDTATKPGKFVPPHRRITWTVYASKRRVPIELVSYPSSILLRKTKTPWPVSYDHRIHISLRSFANDIVKSISGPSGYLRHLQSDASSQKNFEKAMQQFFPQ
jgi:hypothetical protein